MKIETTRFGNIAYEEEHLIHFRDGMIGLVSMKDYIIVESTSFPLVLWLQSIQDQAVAFPLIEPYFFAKDYKVTMTEADRHSLDLVEGEQSKVMIVLTIPSKIEAMTANMRAPIVFNMNRSRGTQVVLQDKVFAVRTPAYEIVARASQAIRSEAKQESQETWTPVLLGGTEKAAALPAAASF